MECANAPEAYKRAYDCSQCKDTTIQSMATKLMCHPRVMEEIRGRYEHVAMISNIDAAEVTRRSAAIAWADITDFVEVNDAGMVVIHPSRQWDKTKRAAVKNVKSRRRIVRERDGGEIETIDCELTLHDPTPHKESIARHIGYYEVDNAQRVGDTQTERLRVYLAALTPEQRREELRHFLAGKAGAPEGHVIEQ